jgi:type IV secretory pathway VirB10-like protein
MPVKRSIRMKQRPRAKASKRAAHTTWWTGKPAIAAAVGCAIAVMIVILIPQKPRAGMAPKKADATIAHDDSTETTDRRPEMATLPVAPPSPSASPAPAVEPSPDTKVARVTIEGCLERADATFRLTDTAGTSAPTSRSWKSGFLKKRPAAIEVRDSVKRVNLASHVGQRVSVTGTLVDRQMRVGSLQPISLSCSTYNSKVKI